MTQPEPPRILIVDDEEAILETMTFTFMDVYEVLTATDGARALELLDEKAPVSVVITDQRMPKMTGVELLAHVFERHPDTVRIMLTGFADAEATIQAINDGHIYAYINKPWEPAELKQVVARAIDHHRLTVENSRLVTTSETAKRPPGLRTRCASRRTRGLSTDRLMTQFEMITSTDWSGRGMPSMSPLRNSAFVIPASVWLRRANSSISSVMSSP